MRTGRRRAGATLRVGTALHGWALACSTIQWEVVRCPTPIRPECFDRGNADECAYAVKDLDDTESIPLNHRAVTSEAFSGRLALLRDLVDERN
jgi:hypothetical protein